MTDLDTESRPGPADLGPPPPVDPPGSGGPGGGSRDPDEPRRRRSRRDAGDVVRTGIRGLGQLLITAGCVLLLFVVYEIWVSNVFADRKQAEVRHEFANQIQTHQDPLHGQDKLNLPAGRQVVLAGGVGFANLYIPRLGKDYAETVVEGTNDFDLERGPGHYANTAVPGQLGNFAVAGHRVGRGEPFLNLDQLKPGDPVVVQTGSNWYVYRVLGDVKTGNLAATDAQGIPGREIVAPTAIQVLDPVPDHPGLTPTQALLTLTTCHPKYSANQRMIVHAALVRSVPAAGQAIPKELSGGTL